MGGLLTRLRLRDPHPLLLPGLLALVGCGWGLLLVRLPFLDGLLLTVVVMVAVGTLIEPLVGVGAALFLGPLWAWLRAEWPQVPPLIGQYVFALTVALWIARGLARRDLRLPLPPLLLPLVTFVGVALLSLWSPVDLWVGFLEWVKWGQILLIFLVVYEQLSGEGGRRRVIALLLILLAVALFQAGVGLWQFALRGEGPQHFAIDERFYRAYGTFEQPNPFGGFSALLGALLTGLVLGVFMEALETRRGPRPWIWPLAAAGAVVGGALLASWSRGAWMGFGAALLVMLALLPRRLLLGLLLVTVLIGGGVALYVTGLLPASISSRLVSFVGYTRFEDVRGTPINDANYAVLERMAHWQAALEMWRANFWLGVGFGGYEPAYSDYALINWPFALGHAHNYYLNLLAETGLLGLLAYLLLFALTLVGVLRATRRLSGWERGVAVGLVGSWMQLSTHHLVDNLLVNNIHLHVGALLALSAWVIARARYGSSVPVTGRS